MFGYFGGKHNYGGRTECGREEERDEGRSEGEEEVRGRKRDGVSRKLKIPNLIGWLLKRREDGR